MKNNYFLLRHGETPYQAQNKSTTYPPPRKKLVSLTSNGKNQIQKVADFLKEKKIDLIFSSDIKRTKQTADIIASKLGLEVRFDKRLRDLNLGIYHGCLVKEFKQFLKPISDSFHKILPGGESWQQVEKRIMDFFKEIDNKYQDKNILIISHGDPLWLLYGNLRGLSQDELLDKKREHNKKYCFEVAKYKILKNSKDKQNHKNQNNQRNQ